MQKTLTLTLSRSTGRGDKDQQMQTMSRYRTALSRVASDYGMAGVLLLLCLYYSWATLKPQQGVGLEAAESLAAEVVAAAQPSSRVLVVARTSREDVLFADTLERALRERGLTVVASVKGEPRDARAALESLAAKGEPVHFIAATADAAEWLVLRDVGERWPTLGSPRVMVPPSGRWPTFLSATNLLNVANQAVLMSLLAVGMTLVIITGGIDLSVGSLVALSAVVSTLLVRRFGGPEAGPGTVALCCACGVLACAAAGAASGSLITLFAIPPFIATLGMMLVARGQAYTRSQGQSVYGMPESFAWLGRGTTLGVSNGLVLMVAVYVATHVLLSRTMLGRYVYAVGGNAEAARLSGVRVKGVLLFVYTLNGALAGLAGVVLSSQLNSGAPTYAVMAELDAIAAVVVGGTSLAGGSGRVFGTLIGALIITVIRNGMNLTHVGNYEQMQVLGLVLLGAVIFDSVRRRGWRLFA